MREKLENKLYNIENIENQVIYRARETAIIQEQIRANIINETNVQRLHQNRHRKDKLLNVGDRILVRNHIKKSKLDLNWLGPGVITKIEKNKCNIRIGHKEMISSVNHVVKLNDVA